MRVAVVTRENVSQEMSEHSIGVLGELTYDECLELLASHEVGRVAVVVEGQPTIFPVNYALDGDLVVFRTAPGTKLTYASLDKVAFEIDEIDARTHEGWSVVVAGVGRELTNALDEASVRERAMPLQPWASGAKDNWIRIVGARITGRRVYRSAPSESRGDPNGLAPTTSEAGSIPK